MKNHKFNVASSGIALLLIAAFAACTNDGMLPEPGNPVNLRFKAKASGANAADTRAMWNYKEEYTLGQKLDFFWESNDQHINIYQYTGNNGEWSTNASKGSILRNLSGSNFYISAQLGSWDKDADALFVMFPYVATRLPEYLPEDPTCLSLPFTINSSLTQTGKDASHLREYMYMYGSIRGDEIVTNVAMELKHASALLRFFVINKGSTRRYVTKVEMKGKIFLDGRIPLPDIANLNDVEMIPGATPADNITISLDHALGPRWDMLESAGQPDSRLALYAACMPTATAGETYTFEVTTADSDGSNPITYTSNVLSGDRILNKRFENGKYYTFELLLDDELTVALPASINHPIGWGNESDEIELK